MTDEVRIVSQTGGEMSSYDLGWLVGLIEGEGSFYQQHKVWDGYEYNYIIFQLSMIDLDIIERLHKLTGWGTVRLQKRQKPGWQDQWRWRIAKQAHVQALILLVYDNLGERRQCVINKLQETETWTMKQS